MPGGCKKIGPTEEPYKCLQKGIGIGKNMSIKISSDLSKDVIREIAARNRIPSYSRKTKAELLEALFNKGVTKFKPFDLTLPRR
jgi:hypothetical protein